MKLLLIDNYDSFTYNVVHQLRLLGADDVEVVRNTALDQLDLNQYAAIIASPGPGLPADAGQLISVVKHCVQQKVPYLGICLGHQALGEVVGAKLYQLDQVQHGIEDSCQHSGGSPLFAGLYEHFHIGRYHSWAVDFTQTNQAIEAFAKTADGCVQAFRVANTPCYGVQFHPESIMTAEAGPRILQNFLQLATPAHA